MADPAKLLVIDDKEDQAIARLLAVDGLVKARGRNPSSVLSEDLTWADLVIVDYELNDWDDGVDSECVSLVPVDGVALAAVLRRSEHKVEDARPTAFAILTGQREKLVQPLSDVQPLAPLVSRLVGVEWVWQKRTDDELLRNQVAALCNATQSLPTSWSEDELTKLLGLEAMQDHNPGLAVECRESAIRCLPPLHAMSAWSDGIAFLRWMLHRVLSYPCMLWSPARVAFRLGLHPKGFERLLPENSGPLADSLRNAQYSGIFNGFNCPLWWGTAIEDALWELTKGESQRPSVVREALIGLGAQDADFFVTEDPVLAYKIGFSQSDTEIVDRSLCIPVHLDDWPSYAELPWMQRSTVLEHPELRATVASDDAWMLEASDDGG